MFCFLQCGNMLCFLWQQVECLCSLFSVACPSSSQLIKATAPPPLQSPSTMKLGCLHLGMQISSGSKWNCTSRGRNDNKPSVQEVTRPPRRLHARAHRGKTITSEVWKFELLTGSTETQEALKSHILLLCLKQQSVQTKSDTHFKLVLSSRPDCARREKTPICMQAPFKSDDSLMLESCTPEDRTVF